MEGLIEVKNVSKEFVKKISKREEKTFFADFEIDFTAKKGEILGILGPNGAGKTTLLRMIAGIMKPTNGSIVIDGMNYNNDEIAIKKQSAFLTGGTRLYKNLSPYEVLKLCGEYYDVIDIEKRIKEISQEFEMNDFLHHKISKLSTGQSQRVGLARCALHNPNYYILDEATSGLDVILRQIVLDFIEREKEKNKCIVYSTHYMEEAESICDRVVIMNKGKLIAIGTPKEIKEKTNTENLRDSFFELVKEFDN